MDKELDKLKFHQKYVINHVELVNINTGKVEHVHKYYDGLTIIRIALCHMNICSFSILLLGTVLCNFPVMDGILDDYLQHYILFSEGLWLLLQSSVALLDVNEAEIFLQYFCLKFAEYYGMYHTYMYTCMHIHTYIYIHTYIPIYAYIHTYIP